MILIGCKAGRRVGMADEADSKSVVGNHVWVQVPSPAGMMFLGGWGLNPVQSPIAGIHMVVIKSKLSDL